MAGSPTSGVAYRTALRIFLFLLVSYHFALNFARTGHYFLPLQDYIDGRASLPFQYRVLMAPIFKTLLQFFSAIDVQNHFSSMPPFVKAPDQLAYAAVNFVGFFCSIALFDRIARRVFNSNVQVFWANFLFIVATYSIFILNPNLDFILPYDLPSLALMQLCVLLVLQRNWILLVLAFIVATINRETSFLVVVFLAGRILFGLEPRRIGAMALAIALTTIWATIKIVLFFAFHGTGGESGIALLKLPYNIAVMLKPWQWPNLLPLVLPLMLCICVSLRQPSKTVLSWSGTYLFGFFALFMVANITEQRAFADLIGFSAIATVFLFYERGLIPRARIDAA